MMENMQFKVSIIKGENPEKMVKNAIELIGGIGSYVKFKEKVLIKPNLCSRKKAKTGATTDPRVVRSIVDLLKDQTNDISIIESDGAATDAEIIWSYCGFTNISKEKNVKLINLSKEPSLIHDDYELPKLLFKDYVLINVPKIKTNDITIITCSLKNLFGLIPSRHRAKYHKNINETIVYLNSMFKTNLTIVDGLICMEGNGPINGKSINMNIIVAGNNPVAVDSVICNLIGLNPRDVDHIRMASDAGLGPMNMNDIDLFGENLNDVKRIFKLPSNTLLKQKLMYKLLENSEKIFLKQAVGILGYLRTKKYSNR